MMRLKVGVGKLFNKALVYATVLWNGLLASLMEYRI